MAGEHSTSEVWTNDAILTTYDKIENPYLHEAQRAEARCWYKNDSPEMSNKFL